MTTGNGSRLARFGMVAAFAVLALAAGCGDDDGTTPEAPIAVDVFFDVNVDGQPLQLNSMIYANDASTSYSIKKLRFVLTDLTMHSTDGKQARLSNLHYYALAGEPDDPSTQSLHIEGGMPHAEWNRVTFTFGLDETKNVRNKYINMAKFHNEMAWPSQMGASLGYHYMQLEGEYEPAAGGTAFYTTHTGAHQLATDPQPLHYYFNVDLPIAATHIHEGGTGELTIHVDLNGWYRDHNLADGDDTEYDFKDLESEPMGQAIMGNPEAQSKLQSNGPFCFSASLESYGGHH